MALTAASRRKPLEGREHPRLAPPTPARSDVADFVKVAEELGIGLFPWQKTAARYLTAKGQGNRWLYRHVAIVVARQNGKTKLLVPLIVQRLRMGQRIMHTAQDRNLPREIYSEVADIMAASPGELAVKNGRIVMPRFANGQEEIRMKNGGIYSIVAPTRGGARGPSRDLVIVDELREMTDNDFIAAANPTLQASQSPQIVYLSNAGDDTSLVLNSIKASQDEDPTLAYLEWSAGPDHAADDMAGWCEANPSIGHLPGLVENLGLDYQTLKARGALPIFETENLCRWVTTVRDRLVDDNAWMACAGPVGTPVRPSLAVSLDPDGKRAAIAIAWMVGRKVALQVVENVTGDPVNTDVLGETLKLLALKHNAKVGYELEDSQLMKYVKKDKGVAFGGGKAKAASAEFARLVSAGDLVWANCDPVTDDLTWTARKQDHDGTYEAVRAKDDHPIPASLAAIRAVYMASLPQTEGRLVVR
jgi:hypothetical protein